MQLPTMYNGLGPHEKRPVRERYIELQKGLCWHCKAPLAGEPPTEVLTKLVDVELFPANFFRSPVHLHHSHDTGLTIGAVHAYCNAVLWQYYGE